MFKLFGGLFGPLTLLLIILKATGAIELSWIWVFAPAWIPAALGFLAMCFSENK